MPTSSPLTVSGSKDHSMLGYLPDASRFSNGQLRKKLLLSFKKLIIIDLHKKLTYDKRYHIS